MATDWTALGLAAIGVAGTIGGGFVGSWIQGRSQERMERQRQQERAAEVVGVAWQLHVDLTPLCLPSMRRRKQPPQKPLS